MTVQWYPWSVSYDAVDRQSMFIEAGARDDPPNSQIVKFYAHEIYGQCAFIKNKETKRVRLYAMDIATRRPYPIDDEEYEECSPAPKKRPRLSREYKEWRKSREWENR